MTEKQVKGYKLEHCRKDCCKSAKNWNELYKELENTLDDLELEKTLEKRFKHIRYHHIPKVVLAGCPNGCSQPQIRDIGIVGYTTPIFTDNECIECLKCIDSCLEGALSWENDTVVLDENLCVSCGDCIQACPTNKIISGESGWQLSLGGRLGRHPQFAKTVGKEQSSEAVVEKIRKVLIDYIHEGQPEERLSQFLDRYTPN